MSYINEVGATRGGSAALASAMGAAMGDGIVPHTARATGSTPRRPLFGRLRKGAAGAASGSDEG